MKTYLSIHLDDSSNKYILKFKLAVFTRGIGSKTMKTSIRVVENYKNYFKQVMTLHMFYFLKVSFFVNLPNCRCLLSLFPTKSLAISTRSIPSVRSLCTFNIVILLNRFWVIVERSQVLLRRAAENDLSADALLHGFTLRRFITVITERIDIFCGSLNFCTLERMS